MATNEKINTATRWKAVTPVAANGGAPIEPTPAALMVGGAGDLVVEGSDGNAETFVCIGGDYLPLQARRVLNTSTATNIVALYND